MKYYRCKRSSQIILNENDCRYLGVQEICLYFNLCKFFREYKPRPGEGPMLHLGVLLNKQNDDEKNRNIPCSVVYFCMLNYVKYQIFL